MKCLHCDKEFENKKDTAKYCSVSCRVMYNRANKDKSKEMMSFEQRIKMYHNGIIEALTEIKNIKAQPTTPIYDATESKKVIYDEFAIFPTPKISIKRTYEYFIKIISSGGCEEVEGHKSFLEELDASDLSENSKRELRQASRVKQS